MEKFNDPKMEAVKLENDEAETVVGGVGAVEAAPVAPLAGDPELLCSSPTAMIWYAGEKK